MQKWGASSCRVAVVCGCWQLNLPLLMAEQRQKLKVSAITSAINTSMKWA